MEEKENNITKYQGLVFAVPFIQEIKKHISNDPKYGNVVDFVREATREKMQSDMLSRQDKEIKKLKKENKKLKEKLILLSGLCLVCEGERPCPRIGL